MTTYHPDPIFIKNLKITRSEAPTKDILLMDDDRPVYGIAMGESQSTGSSRFSWRGFASKPNKDIGQVSHYDQDGGKKVLGEIKWIGDRRDQWRWSGGDWIPLKQVWDRYSLVKDRDVFSDKFVGSNGGNYIWFLDGHLKVLCRDSKENPVLAMHADEGKEEGERLWLTKEAYEAGDMLYITLLTSEGIGARRYFQSGPRKHVSTLGELGAQGWSGSMG